MISLGLDVSATSTGMVLVQLSAPAPKPNVILHKTICPKTRGMERCSDVACEILPSLQQYKPERVVVEGYAGRFKASLIPLIEVGTVVRYFLRQLGYRWLEPAPTQVKKFVLGTGVGEKSLVMQQVLKRWAFEAPNDDIADAFALGCIGLGHAGLLTGLTQPMIEVIGGLKMQ